MLLPARNTLKRAGALSGEVSDSENAPTDPPPNFFQNATVFSAGTFLKNDTNYVGSGRSKLRRRHTQSTRQGRRRRPTPRPTTTPSQGKHAGAGSGGQRARISSPGIHKKKSEKINCPPVNDCNCATAASTAVRRRSAIAVALCVELGVFKSCPRTL